MCPHAVDTNDDLSPVPRPPWLAIWCPPRIL